jgi:hypothetical protein
MSYSQEQKQTVGFPIGVSNDVMLCGVGIISMSRSKFLRRQRHFSFHRYLFTHSQLDFEALGLHSAIL